jgi:hypothetical protein
MKGRTKQAGDETPSGVKHLAITRPEHPAHAEDPLPCLCAIVNGNAAIG